MVEQRQSLKNGNKVKDEDNEERSEDGPGESQEEETLLSAFCQSNSFVFCFRFEFYFISYYV